MLFINWNNYFRMFRRKCHGTCSEGNIDNFACCLLGLFHTLNEPLEVVLTTAEYITPGMHCVDYSYPFLPPISNTVVAVHTTGVLCLPPSGI